MRTKEGAVDGHYHRCRSPIPDRLSSAAGRATKATTSPTKCSRAFPRMPIQAINKAVAYLVDRMRAPGLCYDSDLGDPEQAMKVAKSGAVCFLW
jgi:hypothetical protein